MEHLSIRTQRLLIAQFDENMALSVHLNSLDGDVRTFVPDEVFDTFQKARDVIRFLMQCYDGNTGPFVYPILLSGSENIGYVQAVPLKNSGWEIGYHVAQNHTRKGYATEAVKAFLPAIMKRLDISNMWGICRSDNVASRKVLEKCAFTLKESTVMNYHGEEHEVCKYIYGTY